MSNLSFILLTSPIAKSVALCLTKHSVETLGRRLKNALYTVPVMRTTPIGSHGLASVCESLFADYSGGFRNKVVK
jgi:hypothetical protein